MSRFVTVLQDFHTRFYDFIIAGAIESVPLTRVEPEFELATSGLAYLCRGGEPKEEAVIVYLVCQECVASLGQVLTG